MSDQVALERFQVLTENQKAKFQDWITSRQGVLVWRSQDMSVPRGDMFSPKLDPLGGDNASGPAPHWAYKIHEHVTDLGRFQFAKSFREVGRCKIALSPRPKGFNIVLTKGSTNRVHQKQTKLKRDLGVPEVFYRFEELEAIFEVPEWES